jgi:hypothetical protein
MNKKRMLIVMIVLAVILVIAAFTKPTDRNIKLQTVKAVWGDRVPDVYKAPGYFEQFMNLTAPGVLVDDYGVLKWVRFDTGKDTTFAGIGAFTKVWLRD